MNVAKPWQVTPTELINQAVSYLREETEVSRQMAFLFIDVGVETLFKTFLLLPDSVTAIDLSYTKRLEATDGSFHRLVETIKVAAKDRIGGIDLDAVEYYHGIRNKLYHQGDGIIPTIENTQTYAKIATELLYHLLSVDLRSALHKEQLDKDLIINRSKEAEMELVPIQVELRKWIQRVNTQIVEDLEEKGSEFVKKSFTDELSEYIDKFSRAESQKWKSTIWELLNGNQVIRADTGEVLIVFEDHWDWDLIEALIEASPAGSPPEALEGLYEFLPNFDEYMYYSIVLADDLTEVLILIASNREDYSELITIEDYQMIREYINWDYKTFLFEEDFDALLLEMYITGNEYLQKYSLL